MRKYLLLLLLLISARLAQSQKSFFGVDAGINLANQRIVTNFSVNGASSMGVGFQFNKIKPTFGVFYHHVISEHIGIRVNAQYMGLGYHYKGNSGSDVDINYLTIPITVHYTVYKHLSINAGSYVSFTLGGSNINSQSITETYHKNDFGISLGVEHPLYKNFSLGLTYYIGLKNILLDDTVNGGPGVTINRKCTNRALQFTLIYKLKKLN